MGIFLNEDKLLGQFLSNQEINICKQIAEGYSDLLDHKDLHDKLFEFYSKNNEMPYNTQIAYDQTPDEWISDRLSKVFNP